MHTKWQCHFVYIVKFGVWILQRMLSYVPNRDKFNRKKETRKVLGTIDKHAEISGFSTGLMFLSRFFPGRLLRVTNFSTLYFFFHSYFVRDFFHAAIFTLFSGRLFLGLFFLGRFLPVTQIDTLEPHCSDLHLSVIILILECICVFRGKQATL